MTIEVSPPATTQKAGNSSPVGGVKPQGPNKGAGSSGSGFSAILADQELPAQAGPASIPDEDLESKTPPAPVDSAQAAINLIANEVPAVQVQPSDEGPDSALPKPLVDEADAPGAKLAGLLHSEESDDPSALTPLWVPTLLMPAQAVANTPAADVATPGTSARDVLPQLARAPASVKGAAVAVEGAERVQSASSNSGKPAKLGAPVAESKQVLSASDNSKPLDTKFFAAMEAMKSFQMPKEVQAMPAALSLSLSGSAEAQKPEKSLAKSDFAQTTYGPGVQSLGTTSYSSTSVAEVTASSPEMQVAEQVAFWITQDVQNAEIKLEGLGADPVEVSIRMSGNEAQVSFRTDELQTRDLLDGAAGHLKELLQSQGIVLSGVSVGTSGSGGQNGGEKGSSQGKRQTLAVQVEPTAAAPRSTPVGHRGKSLDIFV